MLSRSAEEYDRLRSQARAYQEPTERLLAKAGLGPGQSCLDAGCGPGEAMRLMARRNGGTAPILGLDIDAGLGAVMLDHLRRKEQGAFDFQAGDLADPALLAGAQFDFVFARLILIHLPDPVAALRRLWGWVAPGGTLAVMDFDIAAAGAFPPRPGVARAVALILATFAGAGRNPSIGSHLPALFHQAASATPRAST